MARKEPFLHPYPCDSVPAFDTKHKAQTLIDYYQAQGHLKKCAHLSLQTCVGDWDKILYGPDCDQHSFEREDSFDKHVFLGCPQDCRLYESARWRRIKKSLRNFWWDFRRGIVGIAEWYQSLAALTQVVWALIILAILALFGFPLFEMILKALTVID